MNDADKAMKNFIGLFQISDRCVKDGKTRVGEFRHKYVLEGRKTARLAHSQPTQLGYDGEKIEFQAANKYRTIVRSTAPLGEILGIDQPNYSI